MHRRLQCLLLPPLVPAFLALGADVSTAIGQVGTPIGLENAALRLAFDAEDGRVVELLDRATGQSFVRGVPDSVGLWQLQLLPGGDPRWVGAVQAGRFRWERAAGMITLCAWSGTDLESARPPSSGSGLGSAAGGPANKRVADHGRRDGGDRGR